jgi:hypothetical protein
LAHSFAASAIFSIQREFAWPPEKICNGFQVTTLQWNAALGDGVWWNAVAWGLLLIYRGNKQHVFSDNSGELFFHKTETLSDVYRCNEKNIIQRTETIVLLCANSASLLPIATSSRGNKFVIN